MNNTEDKEQCLDDSCDVDSLDGERPKIPTQGEYKHVCDITADCEKIITNLNFRPEEELTRMLGETEVLSQSTSSLSDNVVVSPSISTQVLCGDKTVESETNVIEQRQKGACCSTPRKPSSKTSKTNSNLKSTPLGKGPSDKPYCKTKRSASVQDISTKGRDAKLKFTTKRSPSDVLKLGERKSPLDDICCVRETLTSRMRYEKGHNQHEQAECEGDDYLTPTQRKEVELKEIRKEVKNLRKELKEKIEEIDLLKQNIDKEAAAIIEDKDKKIQAIKDELGTLQNEQDDLRQSYTESVRNVATLELTIDSLKETMAIREKKNADIYLEMYRKGQESAKFERNDELERMAVKCDGSSSATIKELLEKLMNTEMELSKWQSLRRQESYETAERPETEADATIRFLKDSFFHYLTDQKESENHLRAIIRIFSFTDPQKKKIANSLTDKKNRKTSI
ncbi:hypothetical protein FSP39_007680 [Pinctada imbricata]|uniref:GRIP domain-containing protein n=1 Tax=Pinctada imbricata TaxID=66713 RepID=A0AA88Y1Q6_PINIB|nr:hypothetical protein FSP39_007680 [Pinctada imbricata]